MDDEKLIEMVRKYEFIYNLKHPKYMDSVKKDMAWKNIGEQLKQSAVACKQRWQCLRDAYRRALNKKKGKQGLAAKNIKQWKYENEMSFVAPFLMERKTQSSVEVTSDGELSDSAYENYAIEYDASEMSNVEVDCSPDVSNIISDNSSTRNIDEVPHKKRKTIQSEASTSAIVMANLLDQNKVEAPRGHDELDRFFLVISDTVKKFPPYVQALAKNKIFSLVSEMELQQLAPPNATPFAFKTSPQSTSPQHANEQTQFFQ
ncbi:hypothetical protein PYW07_003678 [Mythimna separata]|uniref:Transcription factor Adf-1 n=1 Tax=Mythimna separata TaxID=271217 RepID=A0AAD7YNP9_MYTSE|nr:hypothetical protein PYW07_003678 [Mythimna separata]